MLLIVARVTAGTLTAPASAGARQKTRRRTLRSCAACRTATSRCPGQTWSTCTASSAAHAPRHGLPLTKAVRCKPSPVADDSLWPVWCNAEPPNLQGASSERLRRVGKQPCQADAVAAGEQVVAAELTTGGSKDVVMFVIRVADDTGEWTIASRFRHFESVHRSLRGCAPPERTSSNL